MPAQCTNALRTTKENLTMQRCHLLVARPHHILQVSDGHFPLNGRISQISVIHLRGATDKELKGLEYSLYAKLLANTIYVI